MHVLFNIYNTFKRINLVCGTFCLSIPIAHEKEKKLNERTACAKDAKPAKVTTRP